jgi:hypothetical protein
MKWQPLDRTADLPAASAAVEWSRHRADDGATAVSRPASVPFPAGIVPKSSGSIRRTVASSRCESPFQQANMPPVGAVTGVRPDSGSVLPSDGLLISDDPI